MTNKLNNVTTFDKEGFKIERNGEIITLTQSEMREFRYLDSALDGRHSIEWFLDEIADEYISATPEEIAKLEEMLDDDAVCYEANQRFLDYAMGDAGEIERDAMRDELTIAMKAGDC